MKRLPVEQNKLLDKLVQLKNLLYNTIYMEEESSNVNEPSTAIAANQTMGVQLSSAIKKDGVNIIQMQSVVDKKITFNMVSALRILDELQMDELMNKNVIDVPDIDKVIEWLASQFMSLEEFTMDMQKRYIESVLERCSDSDHAAKILGVKQSTLQKLFNQMDIPDKDVVLIEDKNNEGKE